MRRPLIILTLVLGACSAAYGAVILLDLMARKEERSVRPLALSGGTLVLEVGSGGVDVVAATGPPRLEARTVTGLFGGGKLRIERDAAGRVFVRAGCPGPFSVSCSTTLRALVPAGTAVEVSTGSGEIGVRGIRGGVVAETGSGDVDLGDVGGPRITAETGSGEVTGARLDAPLLRAETGSGDVELALLRAPDDVFVDTGSGDAALRVPDVGYRFAVDTGSGDEQIGVRQEPAARRRIRMETGSGDITVRPGR